MIKMIVPLFLLFLCASACTSDSECSSGKICRNKECEQKPLFPLTGYEILGSCLVFFSSGLAGASGVGGGALYVVIYITLFFYNSSNAVALSHFTIVGASVMPSLIKLFLRHPVQNKPLIEFDINAVLASPLMIGTTTGVIMNIMLPYWIITLSLVALLGYLSVKTFKAGIKLFKKETLRVFAEKLTLETSTQATNQDLQKILDQEKRLFPRDSIFWIGLVWLVIISASLIRGSPKFKSILNIEFCSLEYWLLTVVLLIILGILSFFCSKAVISKYNKKLSAGYNFDTSDIKWEIKPCLKLNLAGFLAGLLGAIVGVGGALILSPVLIAFKIRPEVMTATTSFMIVLTSTVSALQFLIAGKIRLDYGLWTIIFSLLGSALGVFGLKGFVEKYKRSSLITLTLGVFQVLSGVVSLIYWIYDSVSRDDVDFGFHNYCK